MYCYTKLSFKKSSYSRDLHFKSHKHNNQVQYLQEMEQDLTEKTEQVSEQETVSNQLKAEKSDYEYKAVKRFRYDN